MKKLHRDSARCWPPRAQSRAGFTLMEVMIAIVILAASTITLLGVQSAVTRRATLDNHKIRAVLAAREILAAAEIAQNPPAAGTYEGTPESVRDQLLGKTSGPTIPPLSDSKELPLAANLKITDWPLPISNEALLSRYELSVSWGVGQGESVTINYFVALP